MDTPELDMDTPDDIADYQYNGNQNGEENDDLDDENLFCTLAVTGTNPTFQGIFICNEADSPEGEAQAPMCVCQACAEVCFDDGYHEVEYVGMGPSYCDCSTMGNCKLHEKSLQEAKRLGIVLPNDSEDTKEDASPAASSEDFIREAFDVPMLQSSESNDAKSEVASLLVEQAQELIKHTKETHWIDESVVGTEDQNQLCLLESLAWSIYRSHRERYKDAMFSDDATEASRGGAEWWVQVKEISPSEANHSNDLDENDTVDDKTTPLSSSIDLHYDKDEALAESFGIGSFPVLSTVTYLTAAPEIAAPTVIFDHTYTQGEDEVMSSMMVSRPRIGKHICFDGRLLHGAPYHPSLLSSPPNETNDNTDEQEQVRSCEAVSKESCFRVTFLVNIWKDRRPASVHVLDDEIRERILSLPQPDQSDQNSLVSLALPMTSVSIPSISFDDEENMPEQLRERIELPFVSNLAEDDDEQQESSMVVVTFPPPPIEDCALLSFGAGLQAYMDYKYNEGDDEDDMESNAGEVNEESPSPLAKQKTQSDYV